MGCKILNDKLPKIIREKDISNIKFIIHYSKKEHTYQEHIKYLLKDLNEKNANINEDISEYSDHNEVGKYFKILLVNIFDKKGDQL